jgi:cation:H+ antiporter
VIGLRPVDPVDATSHPGPPVASTHTDDAPTPPVVAASTLLAALGIVGSVAGLWAGAELLVRGAVAIARRLGVPELVVGLTVVAVGTGLPEAVVTLDAVRTGHPDIAVGNVVGSNSYNLAVVLGSLALARTVPVSRTLVRRDGLALVGATLLGLVFVFDAAVTRTEGAVLLGLWVLYVGVLLRGRVDESDVIEDRDPGPLPRTAVPAVVVGLALVLGGGTLLVSSATTLARAFGVAEWAIGATVVAAGTSTPELAVSLVALLRGRVGLSVGNAVGSSIVNLFGVLGAAALLSPLSVSDAAVGGMVWLTVLVLVFVVALRTGHRLSRPEGALLLGSEVVRWVVGLT